LDSRAAATSVAIALVGLAGDGEDGTECTIWVTESVVVSGAVACIRCTPFMVASLHRETNIDKTRSKIFIVVKFCKQDKFGPRTHDATQILSLTKLCPISCPNE